jgi:hypothetical protein
MDSLERRLQDDAELIRVNVSPELASRIGTAVRATRPKRSGRAELRYPLWLAASLTGVAAAVMLIAFLNYGDAPDPRPEPAEAVVYSIPEYVSEMERELPLRVKTADLAAPLEDELQNLRSDLEKARDNVERDLKFTF